MVVVHQARARVGEHFFAEVVLGRPVELVIGELARARHAGQPEVRRLRRDRGEEHVRHVGRAAAVPAQQRELAGEAGPAVDLDQQIREIDLRQPLLDVLREHAGLAGRVVLGDELPVDQPGLGLQVTHLVEAGELRLLVGELGQALGDLQRA